MKDEASNFSKSRSETFLTKFWLKKTIWVKKCKNLCWVLKLRVPTNPYFWSVEDMIFCPCVLLTNAVVHNHFLPRLFK